MSDFALTRCPGCRTVFRVTPEQLALREGQVRCGRCRAVFDANDQRVAVGAPPPDDFEPPDELAAGRPTVTLRNADALQPVRAAESEESPPLEAKAALPKGEPAPPSLETEAAPASPKAGPAPPSPEA